MLHPSYSDLIKAVNSESGDGETPVVNSRYSIVMATAKRARQIVSGETPLVDAEGKKPLSVAIQEIESGLVKIVAEDEKAAETAEAANDIENAAADTEDPESEK